jgi:hypothetical protein
LSSGEPLKAEAMANKDSGPPYFVALYSLFTPIVLGLAVTDMNIMTFIDEHETLVTGLITIAAAAAGAWAVLNQTNEEKKRAKEQETKRHKATRAVMPLALSQIIEFTQAMAQELDRIYDAVEINESLKKLNQHNLQKQITYNFPILDASVLSNLKEMIEFSENDLGDYVAKLVTIYQINTARLKSLEKYIQPNSFSVLPLDNITNQMHHTAEIHSIAANLFDYARLITKTISFDGPNQDDMRSALLDLEFNFQINNGQFDARYISIKRPFGTIWDDLRPQPL